MNQQEPITENNLTSDPISSESQSKFSALKSKKILILGGVFIILLIITAVFLLPSTSKKPIQVEKNPSVSPAPTIVLTPELQAAVDEAKNAAAANDERQTSQVEDYPWIRTLPLAGDTPAGGRYFVYFDLPKKVFIGKIYSKSSDNVEQIKASIASELKASKGVPIENFKFEWSVFPQ